MSVIKKILIANRAEIAVRIARTCQEMGIKSLAIYTEAESELPHALVTDERACLGAGTLAETYLNQELILKLAKEHHVDAIHPGYGFLSENAEFREAVQKAGLIFIGPKPQAMRLMGDKIQSKVSMQKLGIPLIPGYHGDEQELGFLSQEAEKIGFPVLIKASAGGGGKGMRLVKHADEFAEALQAAKREAAKAFGNDKVLVEKWISNPRHIEIQVLCSQMGKCLYVGERECSIQRRHQKIIEESPSPVVSESLRKAMGEVAVKICEGIQYTGAGTIEFILDDEMNFYFLEMNTRLQVEHPVTEMVYGIDLVKWQIKMAQNDRLSLEQADLVPRGHAMEARIYTEDPDNDFLPTIGKLEQLKIPQIPSVRLDCGYTGGNEITIDYDPMIAKLIAWGEDRDSAIEKLKIALKETVFAGLKTNREYLGRILEHKNFVRGKTYTHFVETYKDDLRPKELDKQEMALLLTSYYFVKNKIGSGREASSEQESGAWNGLGSFRNV